MRQVFLGFLCFYVACGMLPLTPEQDVQVKERGIEVLFLSSNKTAGYNDMQLSLKYKYVDVNGSIHNTTNVGDCLTVKATIEVSEEAHYLAALIVARMTKHMPYSIYSTLLGSAQVAVFADGQDCTIFPEYATERDRPECNNTCDDSCSATCTTDGRKYNTLAGLGGNTACVLEDNLLCNDRDPYYQTYNVLVHEFAHTIHHHLPTSVRTEITEAYNNAYSQDIWPKTSYAMADELEYWAEGTGSFFKVDISTNLGSGMNMCSNTFCQTEEDVRYNIYEKDPDLYYALAYVYVNYELQKPSHLATCVTS
ncbi:uncharacterized protein LOC125649555 [Ostrea edulis]|uniref:uncharacterized protein LOC125649555 n=1 Tax=Ostrea edulis TaxID=37623 RepID=UPI00209635DF|nr:uncharacterized protein LOC125649555 [Ostrea edulis]